jgi:MFS transporter, PAT family, beta-lactamase induction signal transducer AmpG
MIPQKTLFAHLSADRRYAAMLGLGFSSGIPFLLVYVTQSAWLSEAKVPIETIGLMSELTIAYKFKFVWAPFLDKYDAPIFTRLLGRRRGWIVLSQIAVMLALAGIAFGDPAYWLGYTVAFSLALGVAGATQDVTIDGWRITAVPVHKQSVMTAISEMGYRVGTLAAGAGALLLAGRYGWRSAYLCMAALMTVGAVSAFVASEPQSDFTASREHLGFVIAVVAPIKEIVKRLGPLALPILLMIAGFRMPAISRAPWPCRCSKASIIPTPTLPRSRSYLDSGSRSGRRSSAATSSAGLHAEPVAWHGRGIGGTSEPRLAIRARRRRFLDLRRRSRHRRFRLRLRAGCAH